MTWRDVGAVLRGRPKWKSLKYGIGRQRTGSRLDFVKVIDGTNFTKFILTLLLTFVRGT
jgi:hypothetical protein